MNKILLVDDNVELLNMVTFLLVKNSFQVKAISRWEEIYTTLPDFKPDIIIMDIALSGADGRVLCRQLKTSVETEQIPIILFSANHNVDRVYKYLPDAFLAKPFEISKLLSTINCLLEKL